MRNLLIRTGVLLLAVAAPTAVLAQAQGTPQRSSDVPPGLLKVLAKETPGILRALIATQGSSSRLQDLPVSP